MLCNNCGKEIENNAQFCPYCGLRLMMPDTTDMSETREIPEISDMSENTETVSSDKINEASTEPDSQTDELQKNIEKKSKDRREFGIFLLVCGTVLWFVAPFVAVNIATFGDQPTALQLLMDNGDWIGNIYKTPAFWGAVGCLIGIIICFCGLYAKKWALSCGMAFLALADLIWVMIRSLRFDDIELSDIPELFGIGYWGFLIIFFYVLYSSGMENSRIKKQKAGED